MEEKAIGRHMQRVERCSHNPTDSWSLQKLLQAGEGSLIILRKECRPDDT